MGERRDGGEEGWALLWGHPRWMAAKSVGVKVGW